jgi:hypothetical protein
MERIRTLIDFDNDEVRAKAITLLQEHGRGVSLAACTNSGLILESQHIGYQALALWVLEFHREELTVHQARRQPVRVTMNREGQYENQETNRDYQLQDAGEPNNISNTDRNSQFKDDSELTNSTQNAEAEDANAWADIATAGVAS